VGDRAAEGRFLPRPLDVDVDPLVVAGGVGELVHPLLGDVDPVRGAELLTGGGLDLLEGGEHAHRRHSWLRWMALVDGRFGWMAAWQNLPVR
jgi:hypothetical protein